MGLWTRVRALTAPPSRRVVAELGSVYGEELRLARQFRAHAERVPYPTLAANLLGLADREDAHAAEIRSLIVELGGTADPSGTGEPRGGRNYWERLTFDLEDLRAKARRHIELAQHWDTTYPDVAALLVRLARDEAEMSRTIGDMIARSDPHAAD